MVRCLLLITLCYSSTSVIGQTELSRREVQIDNCLTEKVPVNEWNYLINYFENYLNTNGFGGKDNIQKAYLNFIEYRIGYPPKELPALTNREDLKEKLLKLGVIDGKALYGVPFSECFYLSNTNYQNLPESPLKDMISIAEVLSSNQLSSSIVMGGLKISFKEDDLKNTLFKKVIILLGLVDMIYLQEITSGTAKEDNPILRLLKKNEVSSNTTQETYNQNDSRLDKKPEPQGGYTQYLKWAYDNNKKLAPSEELGDYYQTIVAGEVDEMGDLIKIGVWRGLGRGFDEEAYRLVKNHPTKKWIPATINGKPVKVTVEIVIDFRIK